jgi:LacI family transcriptional regulator
MSKFKSEPKRIAVVTELEWPLKRHYEIVTGIQDYAKEHENWVVEVCRFPEVRMESGVHFDGIIGRIDPGNLAAAKQYGIPIVNMMATSLVRDKVPSVIIDIPAAAKLATHHLIKRGMPQLMSIQLRGRNLSQVYGEVAGSIAAEHSIPFRVCNLPARLEDSSDNWRSARDALKEVYEDWSPPVGIVTCTDTSAQIVMTILADMGWHAPYEIAVVSMGNEDICTTMEPTLTSVDFGYIRNGYEAARLLAGLMRGEAPPEQPIVIPPKTLVVRHSSDVFSVRDPDVQKALRYMVDHCDQPIGVPEITKATEVERHTLERRFRSELNTSIYNELHRLRIERAKRLLVEDPAFPIKDLYHECGFATMSNFYAAFKKNTGMSPAAYRKKHSDPRHFEKP